MTKPITDEAKIALEYPDKFYVGTFERTSRFEAHLDPTGSYLPKYSWDCLGRGLARTPTVVICQPSEVPRHSLSGCWALALCGCRDGSCTPWLRNSSISLRKTTA